MHKARTGKPASPHFSTVTTLLTPLPPILTHNPSSWRPAPTSRPQISRDRSNPSTTPQTRLAPPSNPSQGSQQTTHNAWTGAAAQDRNRSQSGARTGGAGKTAGGGPGSGGGGGGVAAGSAGVVEEKHVPVGGFNEAEVREYLGRGIWFHAKLWIYRRGVRCGFCAQQLTSLLTRSLPRCHRKRYVKPLNPLSRKITEHHSIRSRPQILLQALCRRHRIYSTSCLGLET